MTAGSNESEERTPISTQYKNMLQKTGGAKKIQPVVSAGKLMESTGKCATDGRRGKTCNR